MTGSFPALFKFTFGRFCGRIEVEIGRIGGCVLNQEFEEKYAEDLARIRQLCLMDDAFMDVVFQDIPCAELLLRVILERDDLSVKEVKSQYEIKNIYGRSVRLDIRAVDTDERHYDIEVQRRDEGAIPKRARYNSSLLDSVISRAGDDYKDLNETYVIFITENDVLKYNLPIYHIDRMIQETGTLFGDEAHIIYVNGQIKDDTALGRLMHDFFCTNADDMLNPTLADRVRYFKEEEEGAESMSDILEKMRREAAEKAAKQAKQEGIEEGLWLGKRELAWQQARKMLAKKTMSYEEIADFVEVLSIDDIRALDANKTA